MTDCDQLKLRPILDAFDENTTLKSSAKPTPMVKDASRNTGRIDYNDPKVIAIIDTACNAVKKKHVSTLFAAHRKYCMQHGITYGTLRNRFHNFSKPTKEAHNHERLLAPEQEEVLVNWMTFLGNRWDGWTANLQSDTSSEMYGTLWEASGTCLGLALCAAASAGEATQTIGSRSQTSTSFQSCYGHGLLRETFQGVEG